MMETMETGMSSHVDMMAGMDLMTSDMRVMMASSRRPDMGKMAAMMTTMSSSMGQMEDMLSMMRDVRSMMRMEASSSDDMMRMAHARIGAGEMMLIDTAMSVREMMDMMVRMMVREEAAAAS